MAANQIVTRNLTEHSQVNGLVTGQEFQMLIHHNHREVLERELSVSSTYGSTRVRPYSCSILGKLTMFLRKI